MKNITIIKALEIVKNAGFKVQGRGRSVSVSRKDIRRINELLTIHGRVVITSNGKCTSIFTYESHKARMGGINAIHEMRAKKKTQTAPAETPEQTPVAA